jgi:hypothetical protein
LRHARRLDAAVAEQAEIPQRIRARPLFTGARDGLQAIDRFDAL